MTDLKGSETEKNLLNIFAGESKVRNKYTFYSMIAKKEGYDYISKIFDEIANNEKEHAKICFRLLNNGEFPHTMENLEDAAKGELFECSKLYPEYAQKAREEGFEHIADIFIYLAKIEKDHEAKFRKLLLSIKDDVQADGEGNFIWECSLCGATFTQKERPDYCPLCENEDIFFFKKPL